MGVQVTMAVLGLMLMGQAAETAPACEAPQVPVVQRPVKPDRPTTPGCVDEAKARHTCSARVIRDYEARMQAYQVAFEAHVDAVNGYMDTLNTYVSDVNAYVRCEQKMVMPSSVITG